jgi:hypothetical protein
MLDPLRFADEDRDRPGLFLARIPGTNIGIHFVLDIDRRKVCVFSILQQDE